MRKLPFIGFVVWLTPDQAGRASGPPVPDPEGDQPYCSVAYVPPHTVDDGLASFCLAGFEPGAWRSEARGGWLFVTDEQPHHVQPGQVVVVCEGRRVVAYFHVDRVEVS